MANLYDKAGLVNIPVGYQDGFLYNIKPEDNTLGFRFNRDSAATLVNSKGLIEQVGYFGPELVKNGNFSELGGELVTNGDFSTDSDWTKGTGVTISDGKANWNNTSNNIGITQNGALTIGKTYKIKFTISNYVSGSVRIRFPFIEQRIQANGTYIFYGVATTDGIYIQGETQGGDPNFSIDNVSVKQVDPNDYWTLGTGWSFGDGVAICDGSQTGNSSLQQSSVAEVGKVYKIVFDLTVTSGQITYVNLGGWIDNTNLNSSGTYVYTTTTTTATDNFGIAADSNFIGTVDNVSVTEVLGDKPRIDYTNSLTSPSFLLEPQSTNLVEFSEDFSQWTNYSQGTGSLVTLTSNYSISPDGNKNASRIQCVLNGGNTSSDRSYIKLSGFSGTPFTCAKSLYVKNNLNIEQTFFIGVNAVSDRVTLPVSNKWQRLKVEGGVLNTEFRIGIIGGSLNSDSIDIDIFAAQVEALPYATSYIPTSGSTVTRTQETCTGAGSVSTFNDSEGVLYAEIAALANDNTYRFISASSGAYANSVRIGYFTTSNVVEFRVVSGGASQGSLLYTLQNATDIIKIAGRYKQNDFSLWVNGTKVVTDTSGNVPVGLTELAFDDGNASNNSPFYGRTKGVYVFNKALTDDELQQLTGPEYNSFAALAAAYNYTVI